MNIRDDAANAKEIAILNIIATALDTMRDAEIDPACESMWGVMDATGLASQDATEDAILYILEDDTWDDTADATWNAIWCATDEATRLEPTEQGRHVGRYMGRHAGRDVAGAGG